MVNNIEEVIINNSIDPECALYNGEKFIGIIKNETALNDVLAQIKLRARNGIDVSNYYIMFEGEKLVPSKDGRLKHTPDNFYKANDANIEILFDIV